MTSETSEEATDDSSGGGGSSSAQDGAQASYRLVINPTREEMAISKLNLVIAGTSDAVLMVEGFCDFLPEETVLEAMELGLKSVRTLAPCPSARRMQVLITAPRLFPHRYAPSHWPSASGRPRAARPSSKPACAPSQRGSMPW